MSHNVTHALNLNSNIYLYHFATLLTGVRTKSALVWLENKNLMFSRKERISGSFFSKKGELREKKIKLSTKISREKPPLNENMIHVCKNYICRLTLNWKK